MADLTATFESGTNGNTITTAGGEAAATAWDTVVPNSATYDNTHSAHGTLSAKLQQNGDSRLVWSTAFGTRTDHYGRAYIYYTAFPSGAGNEEVRIVFLNGAAEVSTVFITPAGKLQVNDAVFGFSTGTVTASLNQWIRIEWHFIHDTTVGSLEAKLFNTANSLTPDDTVLYTPRDTGAQATEVRFGLPSGTCFSGFTNWFDDIVAGATSYPGPQAETPAPNVLSMQSHVFGHNMW